jgi:hypothetical protein
VGTRTGTWVTHFARSLALGPAAAAAAADDLDDDEFVPL